ncbi:hypothetical protein VTI28DRAFT_1175 [Corynascus sepedonium]
MSFNVHVFLECPPSIVYLVETCASGLWQGNAFCPAPQKDETCGPSSNGSFLAPEMVSFGQHVIDRPTSDSQFEYGSNST